MNYYIDAIEAWKATRPKPRGEWKLGELSNEQLAEVLGQLLNRAKQRSVREFIVKEFGIRINSDRSLSEFFSGVKHFLGTARRRSVMAGAKALGPLTDKEQSEIDVANLGLLRTAINEKLDNPEIESSELGLFVKAFLKLRDQSLTERDIDLKLRRLEALEANSTKATETLRDGSLTMSQREQRMKEIFGIA